MAPAQQSGVGIADLIASLTNDVAGLFRKEIELAKAEASEQVDHAVTAGRSVAIGAVLAIGAVGVFLAALVAGGAALLVQIGLGTSVANFVSALIVTIIVGGIAWALIARGMAQFSARKFNMQRTAHSLQSSVAAVKESL